MAEYTIQKITTEVFKTVGSNQAEVIDGKPIARLVEIIHNNESMRSYAVSIDFERPDDMGNTIRREVDWPIVLGELINKLIARPSVKEIYLSKGSIRIEVSDCYEKLWEEISPGFINTIKNFFWDGSDEVKIVRDDQRQHSSSRLDDY